MQEYMKKANKLIEETDGGLIVYIQNEDGRVAVNAIGKDVEHPYEAILLLKAAFMTCAEMLKLKGGEEVAQLGAENILRTAISMKEPDDVHKAYIVGGRRKEC